MFDCIWLLNKFSLTSFYYSGIKKTAEEWFVLQTFESLKCSFLDFCHCFSPSGFHVTERWPYDRILRSSNIQYTIRVWSELYRYSHVVWNCNDRYRIGRTYFQHSGDGLWCQNVRKDVKTYFGNGIFENEYIILSYRLRAL